MRGWVGWAVAAAAAILLVQAECDGRTSAEVDARDDSLAVDRVLVLQRRAARDAARKPTVVYRDRWRTYPIEEYLAGEGDSVCVPKVVVATADSAITADSVALEATDSLVAAESTHVRRLERQVDDVKALGRKPWLGGSVAFLGRLDPAVRLEGEIAAGRDWQVLVRAAIEADTAGVRRRLEAGVRRSFRLF